VARDTHHLSTTQGVTSPKEPLRHLLRKIPFLFRKRFSPAHSAKMWSIRCPSAARSSKTNVDIPVDRGRMQKADILMRVQESTWYHVAVAAERGVYVQIFHQIFLLFSPFASSVNTYKNKCSIFQIIKCAWLATEATLKLGAHNPSWFTNSDISTALALLQGPGGCTD